MKQWKECISDEEIITVITDNFKAMGFAQKKNIDLGIRMNSRADILTAFLDIPSIKVVLI